jgi:hypothetical protein
MAANTNKRKVLSVKEKVRSYTRNIKRKEES